MCPKENVTYLLRLFGKTGIKGLCHRHCITLTGGAVNFFDGHSDGQFNVMGFLMESLSVYSTLSDLVTVTVTFTSHWRIR